MLLLTIPQIRAQMVRVLTDSNKLSLRGLSVVNNQTLWVSGTGGTVGRSIDEGKTWIWITVPGFEKRDFRDIEAFDDQTALIMAVAEPAAILKTSDGESIGAQFFWILQKECSSMHLILQTKWKALS